MPTRPNSLAASKVGFRGAEQLRADEENQNEQGELQMSIAGIQSEGQATSQSGRVDALSKILATMDSVFQTDDTTVKRGETRERNEQRRQCYGDISISPGKSVEATLNAKMGTPMRNAKLSHGRQASPKEGLKPQSPSQKHSREQHSRSQQRTDKSAPLNTGMSREKVEQALHSRGRNGSEKLSPFQRSRYHADLSSVPLLVPGPGDSLSASPSQILSQEFKPTTAPTGDSPTNRGNTLLGDGMSPVVLAGAGRPASSEPFFNLPPDQVRL